MLKELFDLATKMSAISRYSQTHLIKPESVLEHTGFVCMLAYIISEKVNVDRGNLLSKAVVHDIDEIITGDIPRTTKYANKEIEKAIKQVENSNMIKISEDLLGDRNLHSEWAYAKDDSLEGQIIRLCDLLAVLHKIHLEYIKYGNTTIAQFIFNVDRGLRKLKDEIHHHILRDIIDKALIISKEIKDKLGDEDVNSTLC